MLLVPLNGARVGGVKVQKTVAGAGGGRVILARGRREV